MMDEQNNNAGLLHFVRNDEQKTAKRHCEERSDEAIQKRLTGKK
jgi:hypothetical protein